MFPEFEHGIKRYLSGLSNTEVRTLADVVAFNEAHADGELAWHHQTLLEVCVGSTPLPNRSTGSPAALERIARADFGRRCAASAGCDRRADVRPTVADQPDRRRPLRGNGVAGPSNAAGYPHLTVPAVFIGELPIGISFLGRAWDEPSAPARLRVRAGGAGPSHADVHGCGQRLRVPADR